MALIGNEKFPFTRLWAKNGINLVGSHSNIFSSTNLRRARVEFIAGTNMLKSIKNWMLSAQLINTSGSDSYITDLAETIIQNDRLLKNSATWWALHLSICFSDRSEPYYSFFESLDNHSYDWVELDQLNKLICLKEELEGYSKSSIESNIEGVKAMFVGNSPLAGLGLIDIKKNKNDNSQYVRLGNPNVPDEVIIYALSLAQHHKFPTRKSVDFSELCKSGFCNFLCMPQEKLRRKLKEISNSDKWKKYFSFTDNLNLDSIDFSDALNKNRTIVILLQECRDTWL